MRAFLITLILSDALGAVLTVLFAVLYPLAARKLSARWLSSAALVIFLMSVLPVYRLIPVPKVTRTATRTVMTADVTPRTAKMPTASRPQAAPSSPPADIPVKKPDAPKAHRGDIYVILFCIWLTGAAGYLLLISVSYRRFRKKLRKDAEDRSDTSAVGELSKELHMKKRVTVYRTDAVTSPLILGIRRPTVFLPYTVLPEAEERMALRHELTHVARHDLTAKRAVMIITALHWFDPLCHLLAARFGGLCEAACDETAVKDMTAEEKKTYMNTILRYTERKDSHVR